jgi:LAS superfamily LD-carboxypeptidase LdcB
MGLFKLFIKITIGVLSFSCFTNCKKQEKQITVQSEIIEIKKDTISEFPKYINKDYVLGKFDYTKNDDFADVPENLSNKKIYVRKEVLKAFLEMATEAKKENITLNIISGTRNFSHQKRIWNYKWNDKYKNVSEEKRALKILEYSSMPSSSRHHWGTDIDLINLTNSYFTKGKGLQEYKWLLNNAAKFGFYQVYTSKENGRTGYHEEKWHWTYLPLSSIYLKYYNQHITITDITNFEGSEYAEKIDIIRNYVNGVNPEILPKNY